MNLTVIIPSFNGSGKLPILLSSIASQWVENAQVIIVDDGSAIPITIPDAFTSKMSIQVHRIRNSGRAVARNVGAKLASANILLFCDDDIELCENALQKHLKFHDENTNAILTANPVPPEAANLGEPFQHYRWRTEKSWAVPLKSKGLHRSSFDNFYITTQNLSIRKSSFEKLGGFDERLLDSEDFDFGARALNEGIELYIDGSLQVIHHDHADLGQTLKRQQEYYVWKKKLLQLHPEYEHRFQKHFNWLKSNKADNIRQWLFYRKSGWERFFHTWFFERLPLRLQSLLFSNYIYSNTVLNVKLGTANDIREATYLKSSEPQNSID